MLNILIAEDDIKLNNLFCKALTYSGYHTVSAFNGYDALEILDKEYIDLIISDVMMPKMDGFTLIEYLRDSKSNLPVLFITAKDSYEDKEKSFNLGVDDYMIKPINVNEMVLRVKALLRRAKIASEREIVCGNTTLNYDALTISFGQEEILLPQKEFNLIYKLVSYPNKIFTRAQLMDEIWGMDSETDERTVDVHINRLRDKLCKCDDIEIITVRGLGYKVVKNIEKN